MKRSGRGISIGPGNWNAQHPFGPPCRDIVAHLECMRFIRSVQLLFGELNLVETLNNPSPLAGRFRNISQINRANRACYFLLKPKENLKIRKNGLKFYHT